MREDIVGGSEIGLLALRDQRTGKSHAEELLHYVDAFGARRCRSAGGGFDASAWNVGRLEILKQIFLLETFV